MMDLDSALLAHIGIPPKLLVSLVVLGLALIIWAIVAIAKSGSKKQQQFAPGAPPCPTCGQPGRWNYNGWVCDRCQRAIIPMAPGMAPPGQYGAPPQQMMGQPYMPQPGMPPHQMPQQQAAAHQGPPCQTCGTPGRWIPESNAWGCDRCRAIIMPPAPA